MLLSLAYKAQIPLPPVILKAFTCANDFVKLRFTRQPKEKRLFSLLVSSFHDFCCVTKRREAYRALDAGVILNIISDYCNIMGELEQQFISLHSQFAMVISPLGIVANALVNNSLPSKRQLCYAMGETSKANRARMASEHSSLEPVRETTPLTNGGPKLKKATVPVPNPRRLVFREQLPSNFIGFTVFSIKNNENNAQIRTVQHRELLPKNLRAKISAINFTGF
ncbi:unnamed protein product [Angiostrongylus costaricensis]|uniref:Uncharacterized protein n=1 Tax=Angiostrongylus costaricensis TaxID=334426 RepID=A0A158PHY6_ANGCS|nr:unnamed protein product [Angiostrongylus costaricensis]